ncbi:hypothetical protein PGT21_033117 [Puccinia graminis f. sp. tritici]|uniref:Uncharacterized protein n=1 Tax=Puccinia graminis f. sp. tritici TaxID=56615 RepID=A0A5B0M933_PUCGR|nr:hypothetical protein PGT21_033117 [Puccinia graminis f. sp. tritici]
MFRSTSIASLALIYACKAVDDYHWSQLDSPPTLDGILSYIKTSQAQNSHSDIPLSMGTNTFESISTQEPLLSFHNPNSPPSSAMDSHVHSHLDPVVPDDWNEFWTRDSQDLMRIVNSCKGKEGPWPSVEENQDKNINIVSLSSSSTTAAAQNNLDKQLLSSHENSFKKQKTDNKQNLIKLHQKPDGRTDHNSKNPAIDSSSNSKQNVHLIAPCLNVEAGSSHENVGTVEEHITSLPLDNRKRNSYERNGETNLEKEPAFQSFIVTNPSEPLFYKTLHFKESRFNSEGPSTTLIFDSNIFRIEEASGLDRSRIQKIIEIIDKNGPEKPLMIDVSNPQDAAQDLKKATGRGPNYKSLEEEDHHHHLRSTGNPTKSVWKKRKDLKVKAFEIFASKSQIWFKFYRDKTGIDFQDLEINCERNVGEEDMKMHFTLFLIYVDMISSILVNKEDQKNAELNQNEILIKDAAKNYEFYSQIFIGESTYTISKGRFLDLVWLEVLHWSSGLITKPSFHEFFKNPYTKKNSPLFFHAIFAYSITELSQRISHNSY